MAAARSKNRGPSGWAAFAGVVLFIAGSFNLIFGLAAALNDEIVTVGGGGVIIWDVDAWGWVHFGLGVLMLATSIGLFLVETWARIVAVIFATISAISVQGPSPAGAVPVMESKNHLASRPGTSGERWISVQKVPLTR